MAQPMTPEQFAAELLATAVEVLPQSARVVKKAAQNVKTAAKENVQRSAPTNHAHAHNAITYDEPTITPLGVSSEVGYDKDKRGGALGNLLEYGGGGDKSPAHRDIGRAADDEESRFAAAMLHMAGRLL